MVDFQDIQIPLQKVTVSLHSCAVRWTMPSKWGRSLTKRITPPPISNVCGQVQRQSQMHCSLIQIEYVHSSTSPGTVSIRCHNHNQGIARILWKGVLNFFACKVRANFCGHAPFWRPHPPIWVCIIKNCPCSPMSSLFSWLKDVQVSSCWWTS